MQALRHKEMGERRGSFLEGGEREQAESEQGESEREGLGRERLGDGVSCTGDRERHCVGNGRKGEQQ